jgi:rSAM/selenodomain-associated transferase 2
VIPALNEARGIAATLDQVYRMRGRFEVLVVDGGSDDATAEIASRAGATVLRSGRGRGIQMHAGACAARGGALWFLHADTRPPAEAVEQISSALSNPEVVGGHFALTFDGPGASARLLTFMYPQFRLLGLCYGDSGIFLRAEVYRELGGFRPYPVFEDLDLIRRIRRRGRFVHLPCRLTTSSRRFEGRSFALTFARWTALQVGYWIGVHPEALGRVYRPIRERQNSARRID